MVGAVLAVSAAVMTLAPPYGPGPSLPPANPAAPEADAEDSDAPAPQAAPRPVPDAAGPGAL